MDKFFTWSRDKNPQRVNDTSCFLGDTMYDDADLAFAYGQPQASGTIKQSPDDFCVDEQLGFEPTGEGEHLFLRIEKCGLNTEELVKALARATQCSPKDISYAGLKDRQAVTRQWIGIHCPGQELPFAATLTGEGWRVIESKRHLKKLKTGALAGNVFKLIIRNIQNQEDVDRRLHTIKETGIPNYFGQQRFGFAGQNLIKAERLLLGGVKVKDRFLRGMYYSAARSFLFNRMLSERIRQQCWNKALCGDVMQLEGTNSIFTVPAADETIQSRVQIFDISPALPLWGMGKELATGEALRIQTEALAGFEPWCDALATHRIERHYRAQVLKVNDMFWEWQENVLYLGFSLTAGAYATSVLREMLMLA